MKVRLHNTLSGKVQPLSPSTPGEVRLYSCGPTVYTYAHVGNLRTYIFSDVLRRALRSAGFRVRHVMSVTDVGHLQSDADEGEDKMALAANREARSPWQIARFYEDRFFEDCDRLHIFRPDVVCRATEHVEEMIRFVECLIDRGYAYEAAGNVYFDVGKDEDYGKLVGLNVEEHETRARVAPDPLKRNPRDFVLWFSQSKYPNQIMKWESPWGYGFPGWHIECSAMASKYLGERIDIHTGGVDHIPVHHTNEIAQSEGCFGHRWVDVWMHAGFLVLEDDRMSKSGRNFLRLESLRRMGFEPEHYRYLCLEAHYRSPLKFSWEAMSGARQGFENLKNRVVSWKLSPSKGTSDLRKDDYEGRFWDAVCEDLNMPVALAVAWEVAKDRELSSGARVNLLEEFDEVLGLGVANFGRPTISEEQLALVKARERARELKDWGTADSIRQELLAAGIQLKDTPQGTEWYRTFTD